MGKVLSFKVCCGLFTHIRNKKGDAYIEFSWHVLHSYYTFSIVAMVSWMYRYIKCASLCMHWCLSEIDTQRETRHLLVNDVFHLLTSNVAVTHFHYTEGWSETHKTDRKAWVWEQREPRIARACSSTHTYTDARAQASTLFSWAILNHHNQKLLFTLQFTI